MIGHLTSATYRYALSVARLALLLLPCASTAQAADPPAATAPAAASTSAPADPALDSGREAALLLRLTAGTLPDGFMQLGPEAAPFLAWFVPAQTRPVKGALLVIPAHGQFIGNDAVIAAYMRTFPRGGWSVLAIQTPLLPTVSTTEQYDALSDAALARLDEALAYLAGQNTHEVVLAAQDGGVVLALRLAGSARGRIEAIAALGIWKAEIDPGGVPILDLSAERDTGAVKLAQARQQFARAHEALSYRRYIFAGADRRYLGFADDIADRVRGWAEHLPRAPALAAGP